MLQPLVIYLIFINYSTSPLNYKIISTIIIFIYVFYVLYIILLQRDDIEISTTCSRMGYNWWADTGLKIAYIFSSFSILLLLVRPFNLAVLYSIILMGSLIFATFFDIFKGKKNMFRNPFSMVFIRINNACGYILLF